MVYNTYNKTENIKKSIYAFVESQIPIYTNQDYIVGTGSTNIDFYFNFPEGPELISFDLPSISLDVVTEIPYDEYDLGQDASYKDRFAIDVFARDGRERDRLAGVLKNILYNSVPYMEYDADGVGSCIGYIRNTDIDGSPVRVESLSGEQEYRYLVGFTSVVIEDYP